jgi:cobalt-zinc-cadmium efflux system protein
MQPHPNRRIENRLLLSLALTGLIFIAEVVGGIWTGSLALLSDSAHVFLDLFALGLSFLALRLSALPADDAHTYGYHRLEVLAALANGLTLAFISVGIFYESWQRWQVPTEIKSMEMLIIAVIGLVVNGIVAFILGGHNHDDEESPHKQEDVNVKSAFLHVLGDAISSVGVILAALIIWKTGWQWVDALTSVLIGVIILLSSWRILKSSLHILVEGVPEGITLSKVGKAMETVPGVTGVHDLHIWNICSGHIALSAHVVTANQPLADGNGMMKELKRRLSAFGIEHTTIQFECDNCGQGLAIHLESQPEM